MSSDIDDGVDKEMDSTTPRVGQVRHNTISIDGRRYAATEHNTAELKGKKPDVQDQLVHRASFERNNHEIPSKNGDLTNNSESDGSQKRQRSTDSDETYRSDSSRDYKKLKLARTSIRDFAYPTPISTPEGYQSARTIRNDNSQIQATSLPASQASPKRPVNNCCNDSFRASSSKSNSTFAQAGDGCNSSNPQTVPILDHKANDCMDKRRKRSVSFMLNTVQAG